MKFGGHHVNMLISRTRVATENGERSGRGHRACFLSFGYRISTLYVNPAFTFSALFLVHRVYLLEACSTKHPVNAFRTSHTLTCSITACASDKDSSTSGTEISRQTAHGGQSGRMSGENEREYILEADVLELPLSPDVLTLRNAI